MLNIPKRMKVVTQQTPQKLFCAIYAVAHNILLKSKKETHCTQSRGEDPSMTGQRTQFKSYLEQFNNYLT